VTLFVRNPVADRFRLIHMAGMTLAVTVITIGSAMAKRRAHEAAAAARMAGRFFFTCPGVRGGTDEILAPRSDAGAGIGSHPRDVVSPVCPECASRRSGAGVDLPGDDVAGADGLCRAVWDVLYRSYDFESYIRE